MPLATVYTEFTPETADSIMCVSIVYTPLGEPCEGVLNSSGARRHGILRPGSVK